jgi:hypothetical protein
MYVQMFEDDIACLQNYLNSLKILPFPIYSSVLLVPEDAEV